MFIYDLDLAALNELLRAWDEPDYRALQIWQGLYHHLYDSADKFTTLPKPLRMKLEGELGFAPIKPKIVQVSSDGQTRKTLFELKDGQVIEAVLMKYDPGSYTVKTRRTLCISTQAGCAMGCVFCATGQMGFKRNLSSGEIVAQVLHYARLLREHNESATNIVLMGMGEPFHNYDNSLAAIDRLNNPQGFNFGARRFTISTVGLVPQIKRLADENRQINLAISLHAADDAKRLAIMPVNKKHNIEEVISACHYYVQKTNRRITFEWALIHNVNDSPEVAQQLARRLMGLLCHVNAIPLNPTPAYEGEAASRVRAAAFKETLEKAGIPCTIRMRRGIDIQAGCGQLAGKQVL